MVNEGLAQNPCQFQNLYDWQSEVESIQAIVGIVDGTSVSRWDNYYLEQRSVGCINTQPDEGYGYNTENANSVNWVNAGKVGRVKDQGQCNSGWAFAVKFLFTFFNLYNNYKC